MKLIQRGAVGANGTNGADGKTVRNGSGAPSSGLGVDGDFYIDTTSNILYGPKASGAWGSGVSLIGPQGPAGSPAWANLAYLSVSVGSLGASLTNVLTTGNVVVPASGIIVLLISGMIFVSGWGNGIHTDVKRDGSTSLGQQPDVIAINPELSQKYFAWTVVDSGLTPAATHHYVFQASDAGSVDVNTKVLQLSIVSITP